MAQEEDGSYKKISEVFSQRWGILFKGWFELLNVSVLMGAIYFAYQKNHNPGFLILIAISYLIVYNHYQNMYEKIQMQTIPGIETHWLTRLLWRLLALSVIAGVSSLMVMTVLQIGSSTDVSRINTQTTTKEVQIETFFDGKEGYSISIPSGNVSTCIWTFAGGNETIPGIETTSARTSNEKHVVYKYELYDWKAFCADDLGNQYSGILPISGK